MKTTVEMITIPKAEYDKLTSGYAELTAKVEWLMEQFRLSQHRRFGASSEKSVAFDNEQLNLFTESENLFNESEITSDILVAEPELVEIEKHYRKRKNMVNETNLPTNLLIETNEHERPCEEQICPLWAKKRFAVNSNLFRRKLVLWNTFARSTLAATAKKVSAEYPSSKLLLQTP
jgi:hypothetical protein